MKCPICNEDRPLQSHHIWPIEYGGSKTGRQVDICAACHLSIHYTAEAISSKGGLKKKYLTDEQLLKARFLIKSIVEAKNLQIQDPNNPRKIMLEVPHTTLVKLHKRKLDLGFKSLDSYLKALIENEIKNI